MTNEELLAQTKNDIRKCEQEINSLQDFKVIVKTAIEKFLSDKYSALDKAIAEYGNFEEIQTAYGYGFITKRKYEKLNDLQKQRESDSTNKLMTEILRFLEGRNEELNRHLAVLRRVYELQEDI